MNKKKILTLSIVVIALVILLAGGTYAWYVWSTSSEDEVQVLAGLDAATVVYTGGSNITGVRLKPTETKEEGIVKSIKVYSKEDVYYTLKFNLYLDILSLPEGLKDVSFKYSFYKGDTLVKEGSFTDDYLSSNLVTCSTNNTNHIVLLNNEEITSNLAEYILYIWIDGNLPNPDTMQGLDFSFKLHAAGTNAILEEPRLVDHISNLYNNASKTVITNNGIKYNQANIYNIDDDNTTSGGLMNDRLGGTISDYDAGNIRYYGKNPSNYIDIGDTEIDSNGNEVPTLYRIIGLFKDITVVNADGTTTTKDLVKVIRKAVIGQYAWDNKSNEIGTATNTSGYGSNNWSDARLMMLLNPGYEDGLIAKDGDVIYGYPGSLYWNSESGTCYSENSNSTKSCDFKTKRTGLSTIAQNKIETVVWDLMGWRTTSVSPSEIYNKEREGNVFDTATRATEWTGKVALMYPSDYGYATDLNSTNCSSYLSSYNSSKNSYGCRGNNWLYSSSSNFWTLTPGSSSDYIVWYLYLDGAVRSGSPATAYYVRPVFYLDSGLLIESGSGTQTDPYVIS